jgi:predicted regulator of Ras-like GTPase activity (Roadblock/LC7/MglB family)
MNTTVEQEFQEITAAIPDIRWLRIISADGIIHPTARFDAGSVRRDTEIDKEEDRGGPLSAAVMGLSERIMAEMRLGNARYVVMAGDSSTYFLLPIGDGSEWFMGFLVKGQPSVDAILQYFQERDYLASIIPLLRMA